MSRKPNALADYTRAFEDSEAPFLYYYRFPEQGNYVETRLTRGAFWDLAQRAATLLAANGSGPGTRQIHGFGCNHYLDLVFRMGAWLIGAVPVTVNWQADRIEEIHYKIAASESRLFIYHDSFDQNQLQSIVSSSGNLRFLRAEELLVQGTDKTPSTRVTPHRDADEEQIVIFTSGTTGQPKGVKHLFRAYEANAKTFDSFLGTADQPWSVLLVNPLHHANATAMADWCLRHPGMILHLAERYTTRFWNVVADLNTKQTVMPATAKHFEILENLNSDRTLSAPSSKLSGALANLTLLVGSAPVGPTSIARIVALTGRTPLVRFGSTETCLQVMGIPRELTEAAVLEAFERGWQHRQGKVPGFYIGRPHMNHTEVEIVKSTTPLDPDFLIPCHEGQAGFLIARGKNLMEGYLNDQESTDRVIHDGWYTGLGDKGFFLTSVTDGHRDYYWIGRESAFLLKGGANYAYEQIATRLKQHIRAENGLSEPDYNLAVVGIRVTSEHEDACCVTVEIADHPNDETATALANCLFGKPATRLPKAFRPDFLRFARIPRNFKGAPLTPELKSEY